VRHIENTALAIIELPEKKHKAGNKKAHVRGACNNRRFRVLHQPPTQRLNKFFRACEVLNYIKQQYIVELTEIEVWDACVQVMLYKRIKSIPRSQRVVIYTAYSASQSFLKKHTNVPTSTSQIKDPGPGRYMTKDFRVRTLITKLQFIMLVEATRTIEVWGIKQAHDLKSSFNSDFRAMRS